MLGRLLQGPLRALTAELNLLMAAEGFADLRPAHSVVFMNLDSEGTRISDLAERAQITKQSMGALVSYLEKRGYVSVSPDPRDHRAKLVRRTEKGLANEVPARRNVARITERWARLLDDGEMEELVRLLRKLDDRLHNERELT
jgi:DNA-binding MarR family transcriptional regulator